MSAREPSPSVAWPLRIYYDARCPLCARELGLLAQHDRAGRLVLVDCSAPGFSDEDTRAAGLEATRLMSRVHGRDAAGAWLVGIEVFEAAYGAAGLHGVARAFAHPRLRPLWDWMYPWVADHRMGLSRLGLDRPFGWLIARAASRASARADACARGACRLPGPSTAPTEPPRRVHGPVP
jgi:predicted DCC family thiol-disulfide oxidoreductase YuxK